MSSRSSPHFRMSKIAVQIVFGCSCFTRIFPEDVYLALRTKKNEDEKKTCCIDKNIVLSVLSKNSSVDSGDLLLNLTRKKKFFFQSVID